MRKTQKLKGYFVEPIVVLSYRNQGLLGVALLHSTTHTSFTWSYRPFEYLIANEKSVHIELYFLVVEKDLVAKLADFTIAEQLTPDDENLYNKAGNPNFMAPENFKFN